MLIDTLGVPQYFYYDDISDEYFLVTKQALQEDVNNGIEQLSCHLVAGNGDEKWTTKYTLKGNLVNVVLTNSNYFIFVNASDFSNGADFKFDGKNETSAFGIYINHDGSIKGYHKFDSDGGLVLSSAMKVNSNILSLVGRSNPQNKNEPVFLLVSPDGEIVFKNKEEIRNSFNP